VDECTTKAFVDAIIFYEKFRNRAGMGKNRKTIPAHGKLPVGWMREKKNRRRSAAGWETTFFRARRQLDFNIFLL
jgi:hypothetical protein